MKNRQKLKLHDLTVQSFVANLEIAEVKTINGGYGAVNVSGLTCVDPPRLDVDTVETRPRIVTIPLIL